MQIGKIQIEKIPYTGNISKYTAIHLLNSYEKLKGIMCVINDDKIERAGMQMLIDGKELFPKNFDIRLIAGRPELSFKDTITPLDVDINNTKIDINIDIETNETILKTVDLYFFLE